MAKYELQTKKTGASVEDFLNAVEDEQKRADAFAVAEMMRKATKAEPKMWGPAIVGFGSDKHKYPDGREMDWMQIAFSPRKAGLTIYLHTPMDFYAELFGKLGKHSTSKACLYIKRLSDVDQKVLKQLIAASLKRTNSKK
jgi:hypothetical protein